MGRAMKDARRWGLFNTTAFRLSMGYTFLVALAVCVTLGSAYLLTRASSGRGRSHHRYRAEEPAEQVRPQRHSRSHRRDQSAHRQLGADRRRLHAGGPNFERLAGNVTNWPFDGVPGRALAGVSRSQSIEPGQRSVHPVRAGGAQAARTATGCSSAPTCRRVAASRGSSRSPRCGASASRSWRPPSRGSGSASGWRGASAMSPVPACGSCRASRGGGCRWPGPATSSTRWRRR